jgi:hypothetical protein
VKELYRDGETVGKRLGQMGERATKAKDARFAAALREGNVTIVVYFAGTAAMGETNRAVAENLLKQKVFDYIKNAVVDPPVNKKIKNNIKIVFISEK